MEENKQISCIEITNLEPDQFEKLRSLFTGYQQGYVRVGKNKYLIASELEQYVDDIYNIQVRPSDTYVASYMRSGTTVVQELVWLVQNDLNYDAAKSVSLLERYIFLEILMYVNEFTKKSLFENNINLEQPPRFMRMKMPPSEVMDNAIDPRYVKTHMPFSLLPSKLLETAKVVYVARDPRDVAVSGYHFSKLFKMVGFTGDFKQFWNLFINDLCLMTPYFSHVKEAWAKRHNNNMLFIFYEELMQELPGTIEKVSCFFNKQFTREQIAGLCDHLDIGNFKNNSSVNYEALRMFGILETTEKFIRQGKVGGWRDYFDEEMTQQAEDWIAHNLLDTDLRFPTV